jgi:hypothetical protein
LKSGTKSFQILKVQILGPWYSGDYCISFFSDVQFLWATSHGIMATFSPEKFFLIVLPFSKISLPRLTTFTTVKFRLFSQPKMVTFKSRKRHFFSPVFA